MAVGRLIAIDLSSEISARLCQSNAKFPIRCPMKAGMLRRSVVDGFQAVAIRQYSQECTDDLMGQPIADAHVPEEAEGRVLDM